MNAQYVIPVGLERRKEDYDLITGHAAYVDDLRLAAGRPPVLHMIVVRSPYAHARITAINLEAARAVEGVVAVYTGSELVENLPALPVFPWPGLPMKQPERRPLAVDKVRYVGDPVVVVLAENQYAASDARDLVDIDYEPLPAVTDLDHAIEPDAPLLYEELGDNVIYRAPMQGGDVQAAFEQADHTVKLRLENQRISPASMESRACLFDFDVESGQFSAWVSGQNVFQTRDVLAYFLQIPPDHIRVQNAEVGGAFGAKAIFLGEEIIAAVLAKRHARPVKWIEDRGENLQAHMHGRGQVDYIEAAYTSEGRLLGLKVQILSDVGAFLYGVGPLLPLLSAMMLSGPYRIQAISYEIVSVLTNKVPTGAYRGAGRPEATYILERTMERIARELGLDPAEVRRRNLIASTSFPYQTPVGMVYDSGNYEAALDKALLLADYAGWRERQRHNKDERKLPGIGISTFVETTGGPAPGDSRQEAATVRILPDGTILVQSPVAHNGQGHYTTLAQIAALVLDMPGSQVEVVLNDSALPGYSSGTNSSRITQTAGVAVHLATQAVRDKALRLAASVLEASVDDLSATQGRIVVNGAPARSIELGELARMVEAQPDLIEHEPPNPANGAPIEGLAAWHAFSPTSPTFSSGTHIAIVEVDRETGEVQLLRYIAVDDGGRILNHYLADAQMHGGLAQGIGQALFEGVVYSEDGQNLTSTLMDYALPLAGQLPNFELDIIETPSPINPLGVKGVGEAGAIAAPPTVVNAVLDALAPLGIKAIDMPMLPEKIWSLIQAARK